MNIVITGASGFIGRNLVSNLRNHKVNLLLVGRRPETLKQLFPDYSVCGYEQIVHYGTGFDCVVHLAVMNNDSKASEVEFHEANIALTLEVALAAKNARIPRFIYISSFHALDIRNNSLYALTKRKAAAELSEIYGLSTQTVYLPLVYADQWCGRLGWLNQLPKKFAEVLFVPLSALKPTVHIKRLAEFIVAPLPLVDGDTLVIADDINDNCIYRLVKRLIDLSFVLLVSVFLGWAMMLIWAVIRLQSSGPGIFSQERVGRNGITFTCYKFRTMAQFTEQVATHNLDSGAITLVGGFLRKTKLDELPQILNILRNEISLVGPRPCLTTQKELVDERRIRGVLSLKPGITGLAQVNGIDMSNALKLARWDARYRLHRSLLLDLKIIVLTALGHGRGDRIRK